MERVYNKLVRDNIPEIIKEKGEEPITRILESKEYKISLEEKLFEEYKEVIESSEEERLEELADMIEVIKSLAESQNKTLEDVIELANQKREKRGGFEKRIFLEKVIENKKTLIK